MVRMQIVGFLGIHECRMVMPIKISTCVVVSTALNFAIEGEPPRLPVVFKEVGIPRKMLRRDVKVGLRVSSPFRNDASHHSSD